MPSANTSYIASIVQSISNIIATMASIEANRGKSFYKKNNVAHGVVSASIGMVSPNAKGSLALSFSKEAILKIISNMLQEEFLEVNDEVADCVGELTNMVAGGAKKIMSEEGFDFDMATPVVVCGPDHQIVHNIKGTVVTIPFEIDSREFYAEICFEDNSTKERSSLDKEHKDVNTGRSAHILVIESDFASAITLQRLLEKNNYRVSVAKDLTSVKNIAKKRDDFDLVLLEPMLQVSKGERLHSIFNAVEVFSDIPVIYISVLFEHEFEVLFGKHNADAYIEKPISIKGLTSVINSILKVNEPTDKTL
ncbi:chemotaxis protein CheX [Aliikangiella coralliicola]|uniref:chemotaxis protein CheX n=1 Tax=Aliikangiella coralliicola TaxID=2592383 RepID=UPI00143DBF70|nr:chemotaxis protein CheX [Aliikangiella coralliicola]